LGSDRPLISAEDIKQIFGDLEIIMNYNSVFLTDLEQRLENWSIWAKVGDVFRNMVKKKNSKKSLRKKERERVVCTFEDC